jgi:hypothetical protein
MLESLRDDAFFLGSFTSKFLRKSIKSFPSFSKVQQSHRNRITFAIVRNIRMNFVVLEQFSTDGAWNVVWTFQKVNLSFLELFIKVDIIVALVCSSMTSMLFSISYENL